MSQLSLIKNSSGYIVQASGIGPLMMSWLAENYHFT